MASFESVARFFVFLFVFCSLLLIDGARATEIYCMGGGQLAGVIFGCIAGTVPIVGALFLAVFYFRGKLTKGSLKDIRMDSLGDQQPNSQMNSRTTTLTSSPMNCDNRCAACGCSRQQQQDSSNDNPVKTTTPTMLSNREIGNFSDQRLPVPNSANPSNLSHQINNDVQNSSGGEYRMKRSRNNSAYSSWWTRCNAPKPRRNSYCGDSLNPIYEIVRVQLKSRDTNGLGFNIYGNVRDGIFVRSLSNRGPAKESGRIKEGDRIVSMTIDFENIVFEDAFTIISYASAYPVTLELQNSDHATAPTKDFFNDSVPIGVKSFSNNSNPNNRTTSTPSKSSKVICHPFFKSQSIEDIRSFHSTPSSTQHFSISDTVDRVVRHGDVERTRAAEWSSSIERYPDETPISPVKASSSPKPICSLEIVEETPQLPRRSPLMPRSLMNGGDAHSIASSTSLEMLDTSNAAANGDHSPRSCGPSSTTITVTAEINASPRRDEEDNIVIQDPYAGLSYEDRLQIIRLSYEDACSRSASQLTAQPQADELNPTDVSHPSPKLLETRILSAGEIVRHTNDFRTLGNEKSLHANEDDGSFEKNKLQEQQFDEREFTTSTTDEDALSLGESPSSLESSIDRGDQHDVPCPTDSPSRSKKIRSTTSFTSPSGCSSISNESAEDNHRHSPNDDDAKRDSGYDVPHNGTGSATDDEIEREQYEKLLYFQRQLAKQHEELARLGIHLPVDTEAIQKAAEATALDHRP